MPADALDLAKVAPRSPRNTEIAGYVIASRCLDKCRSAIAGTLDEYRSNCPLDNLWLNFIGLTYEDFRSYIEKNDPSDLEIIAWIESNFPKETEEIVGWNNKMRYTRISELPMPQQVFLETYIPTNIPKGKFINYWFDVYDIEEGRQ